MSCDFELQKLDGNIVLVTIRNCTSSIDSEAYDHFNDAIDNLEKDGYAKYIFDLRYLNIINGSFVGLIAKKHYDLSQRGGRIAIMTPKDMVNRSFEMSGLADILHFFSDQVEAANSFKE